MGFMGNPWLALCAMRIQRKFDARWAPSWQPMAGNEGFKDGDISDGESTEFNYRLEEYSSNIATGRTAIDQVEKPGIFHMAAYLCALLIGGKFGWQFGDEFGGTVLGVAGAAFGVIVLSSLVGLVATLFGYRVK